MGERRMGERRERNKQTNCPNITLHSNPQFFALYPWFLQANPEKLALGWISRLETVLEDVPSIKKTFQCRFELDSLAVSCLNRSVSLTAWKIWNVWKLFRVLSKPVFLTGAMSSCVDLNSQNCPAKFNTAGDGKPCSKQCTKSICWHTGNLLPQPPPEGTALLGTSFLSLSTL